MSSSVRILFCCVLLASSCDMTEEERWFPPHPITFPYTCETGDYFIRMGEESVGNTFFIDDSTKAFYSFWRNNISKYELPGLRVERTESLPSQETILYSCRRDKTSEWLFTTDNSGSLVAYATDTALNVIYRKEIGLPPIGLYGIIRTADRGFVIVANFYEIGDSKYSVLRFSETGDLLWREDVVSEANVRTVIALKDGGFLIGGSINIFAASFIFENDFLTKMDGAGKVLWTKSSHSGNVSNAYSFWNVVEDDSGDYFLLLTDGAGSTNLLRTDSAFNIKLSTTISGEFIANMATLYPVEDGILILSSQPFGDSNDIFFEYYSDDGDLKWRNRFGGTASEGASAVCKVDGGYYLIGGVNYYPEPSYLGVSRTYLVKTDEEGRSCQ